MSLFRKEANPLSNVRLINVTVVEQSFFIFVKSY